MNYQPQQRRFSRVPFNTLVELEQGERQLQGDLLDLSLNGLLVVQRDAGHLDPNQPLLARVLLADDACIVMHGRLAHREAEYLGIACETIDVTSIGHLRRLLELNLGNPKAMERELSELIASQN